MKEITLTKDQILNDDELGAIYRKTKQIKEITKQVSQSYLHAINLICQLPRVKTRGL